jgi:hypothetical protein
MKKKRNKKKLSSFSAFFIHEFPSSWCVIECVLDLEILEMDLTQSGMML